MGNGKSKSYAKMQRILKHVPSIFATHLVQSWGQPRGVQTKHKGKKETRLSKSSSGARSFLHNDMLHNEVFQYS